MRVSPLRERVDRKRVGNYELGNTLGEGTFGKVKYAVNTLTKEEVAIKVLSKDKIYEQNIGQQIKREIAILKQITTTTQRKSNDASRHVVQLYEVLASKTKLYLVLELVKGGELFDIRTLAWFTASRADNVTEDVLFAARLSVAGM